MDRVLPSGVTKKTPEPCANLESAASSRLLITPSLSTSNGSSGLLSNVAEYLPSFSVIFTSTSGLFLWLFATLLRKASVMPA